ncbi:MAG: septum formation inhibitor Maf [Gammaproteobacteria bacterium]|nr:MAG: septum formation inhibitor Maf [Gammaproteobacteria bacterium]
MSRPRLVLASTSPYRRELLRRLGLPFDCLAPQVDESPRPGETPQALVRRLSRDKALAVAAGPESLVIGSDQAAVCAGEVLGKPGGAEAARAQLRFLSGRTVVFHTGLCVHEVRTGRLHEACVDTEVVFRSLTEDEIARYLEKERPYDCAGSFKSEGLGITLFEAIRSEDPTALVGLPLIRLAAFLRRCGLPLP